MNEFYIMIETILKNLTSNGLTINIVLILIGVFIWLYNESIKQYRESENKINTRIDSELLIYGELEIAILRFINNQTREYEEALYKLISKSYSILTIALITQLRDWMQTMETSKLELILISLRQQISEIKQKQSVRYNNYKGGLGWITQVANDVKIFFYPIKVISVLIAVGFFIFTTIYIITNNQLNDESKLYFLSLQVLFILIILSYVLIVDELAYFRILKNNWVRLGNTMIMFVLCGLFAFAIAKYIRFLPEIGVILWFVYMTGIFPRGINKDN